MINDFQNLFNLSLTVGTVIENLAVALVCSLIIAVFYRYTYRGPGFSVSFIHSLVILSLITALVIMVIGNNLARAFGLVGAMSIIRFRTPVKEAMDIVYIFFALTIGMAAGVGLHFVAIWGTLFVGTVLTFLSKSNFLSPKKGKYLLQFNYINTNGIEDPPYIPMIKRFCRKYNLLNIKSVGIGNELELSYYVDMRDKDQNSVFISGLNGVNGVSRVTLYYDDENF
jgi:uncharacterized membrane protein YhiD involved in acid resistance